MEGTEDIYRGTGRVGRSGLNVLCEAERDPEVRMTLGFIRLSASTTERLETAGRESALVVLSGRGTLRAGAQSLPFNRPSWIADAPAVAHGPAETLLAVEADGPCELVLVQTPNEKHFEPRLIPPERVRTEERGKGKLGDTAFRLVRTAFDRSDSPAEAKLVVGEVMAYPGHWSSYPPHHHRQPELYYYRFEPPRGYGHAECGDNVYKVQEHDVLRIVGAKDHAQCAAPGYHMYYLWAVRHLDEAPYTGFEYSAEHAWTFK